MLMPKRVKRRKQFRGSMKGKALRGNTISYGEFGLVATEPCWIKMCIRDSPYTPSRRHMTGSDFSEITKSTPEKSLLVSLQKQSGRNNQGKITVRHRGGGSRKKYRIIDFKRNKDGIPATVIGIEYDPNRTANIALICYADGQKAYILAPQGLKVGMKVMNGPEAEVRVGNCLPLSEIPVGTQVHNIEPVSYTHLDVYKRQEQAFPDTHSLLHDGERIPRLFPL